MAFPWGNSSSPFTGYDTTQTAGFDQTAEWNLYKDTYEEYRVIGMKITMQPGQHLGSSSDIRVVGDMHCGSS